MRPLRVTMATRPNGPLISTVPDDVPTVTARRAGPCTCITFTPGPGATANLPSGSELRRPPSTDNSVPSDAMTMTAVLRLAIEMRVGSSVIDERV